jgi:hypothetical protein
LERLRGEVVQNEVDQGNWAILQPKLEEKCFKEERKQQVNFRALEGRGSVKLSRSRQLGNLTTEG